MHGLICQVQEKKYNFGWNLYHKLQFNELKE